MSFCQSCGAAFADGTTFCPKCSVRPQAMAAPAAANSGLTANTAGALAYLAGIVTGILFLVIDPYKSDRFVRFHAFQSIFFNVAWIALWIAWTIVGLVLGAVTKGLFFILQVPIDLVIMVRKGNTLARFMYISCPCNTDNIKPLARTVASRL